MVPERKEQIKSRNGGAGRALGAAAAIAPLLVAGAHADDAAAKTFTVSSKRANGKGTLRKALKQAERHKGSDRIVFRSRLSGKVKLRGDVKVRGPLKVVGPGRRGLMVRGSDAGSELVFEPPFRKKPRATRLTISDLSLERVALRAQGGRSSDLRLIDSRLSGGGIDFTGVENDGSYGNAKLRIAGSTVQGFAQAGVQVDSNYDQGSRIERSVIRGNGTGVVIFTASATIKNSTVSGNSLGGGVLASSYGFAGITKSTISGNKVVSDSDSDRVSSGGGVDAFYESFARISNSTISGNSADGPGSVGGGIYGSASVTSSTVTGNSAERGGGIFSAPDAFGTDGVDDISDSIVAGNAASTGADCDGNPDSGPPNSNGGNVFGPGGCGTPTASDLLTERPRLGPLADNGGPTFTHELQHGSPAINHSGKTEIETDQRGVRRGKNPDSGSFERR